MYLFRYILNTYTRKKVINGKEYFYEMTPYYDKETKKIRYHSRYLGVSNGSGIGKVRARMPRNIFTYGPFIPVLRIVRKMGIDKMLESLLSNEDKNMLLALAIARAVRSLPMDLVHTWYEGTYLARELPCTITSQRISRLMEYIGNSNIPDRFFSLLAGKIKPESSLFYDITSIASYSSNSMFEYGHAKDNIDLPEINMSLIMERKSSTPFFFEIYPGSIVDVSTLELSLKRVENLASNMVIILDRGFFSLDNLKLLSRYGYIIAATYSRKEIKHVFSSNLRKLDSANNTFMYYGKAIFAMDVEFSIAGMELKGYLYHDIELESKERIAFHRKLREIIDAAGRAVPKTGKSAQSQQIKTIAGGYGKFISATVKDGKYVVHARNNAISQKENRMGRFLLVYKGEYTPVECLNLYRDKDHVEKAFEILKTDLDIFPLRTGTPATTKGLIFVLFISLILRLRIRKMMSESGLSRKYSIDKAFLELEKLQMIDIDGKLVERERTKKQKEILDALESISCT